MSRLYGWTDYPIKELGDTLGEYAPVRSCVVVGYDGDKYCDVVVGGVKTNFKRAYIYKTKGRLGSQTFKRSKLETLRLFQENGT